LDRPALASPWSRDVELAERSFQEFINAILTVDDEIGLETIARRKTQRFGFRWFAYLCVTENAPMLTG